jgi:hypothetical protein
MCTTTSCPCPLGAGSVTKLGTPPSLKSNSLRWLLSFALLFGITLFANAPSAFAQTGLAVTKNVVPNSAPQGTTVTATFTIENQDPLHGVDTITVTNQIPFPGGAITPVVGCATSLTASDGVPGSGTDFTTCSIQETIPITCSTQNEFVTDQVDVNGLVNAPGDILDNLPVRGVTTFAVLATPLLCPDDANLCNGTPSCVPNVGCVNGDPVVCPDDGNVCNGPEACVPATGLCASGPPLDCGQSDQCADRGCDPVTGCFTTDTSARCNDNDPCTDDLCDPATGCSNPPTEPPPAECVPGNEGCTPGFWKNNALKKDASQWPVPTNTTLGSIFTFPAGNCGCSTDFGSLTLLQALSLQGGPDVCGKLEILLRAAAAAYLNSSSGSIDFPISTGVLVTEVNTALASCDSSAIITEATRLDGFNNLGCPISQNP